MNKQEEENTFNKISNPKSSSEDELRTGQIADAKNDSQSLDNQSSDETMMSQDESTGTQDTDKKEKILDLDGDVDNDIEEAKTRKSSKVKKSESKTKKINIRGYHWFDLLFALILFLSLGLELSCLIWYNTKPDSFTWEFAINIFNNNDINYYFKHYGSYINEVIMTLFPILISILNISISVSNQDIYGLKLSNYRRLDKRSPYTILGMTILSFSMLFLAVAFYCLKLYLSMLVLNVAAFIYTIYFCYLVIPVLARFEKTRHGTNNILKNGLEFYFSKSSNDSSDCNTNVKPKEDLWTKDLEIAVGNFVTLHGLKESEDILSIDKENISHFNFVFRQYSEVMKAKFDDDKENKIVLLDSAFSDLEYYFNRLRGKSISIGDSYDVLDVSSLIYVVLDYIEKHNLNSNYNIDMFNLYYSFLPKLYGANNKARSFTNSVSIYLLVRTLNNGQLFYCNWIKNCVHHTVNLDLAPHYLIFISLYLYYLENHSLTDKTLKKKIKEFSDDIWKNIIADDCKIVKRCSSVFRITDLYKDLLSYSENMSKTVLHNKLYYAYDKPIFDDRYITSWYITAFFAGNIELETNKKFTNEIDIELENRQNKRLVKDILKREWIERVEDTNKFKINSIFKGYFRQFKISLSFSSDMSKNLKEYLMSYSEMRDTTKTKSDSKPLTDKEIANVTRKSISLLKKGINKIPILDKKIDLSDEHAVHKSNLTLSDSNYNEILDNLNFCKDKTAMFKRLVYWIMRDLSESHVPNKYISDEFISKIVLSKPNDYFAMKNKGKKCRCINIDDKTYYMDSISINLNLVEDSVLFKKLDEDETNRYLDEEFYGSKNGYKDIKTGREWDTRNDVKKELGAIWYQLSFDIVFRIEIKKDLLMELDKQ